MTQRKGALDVLPQPVDRPTDSPSLRKEANDQQTGVGPTPSPKRRWVWFAALATTAVIILAIAVGVVSLRSGEVSQPPAGSGEAELDTADRHHFNYTRRPSAGLHPADRHLFNAVPPQAARDVDAARFSGRYSNLGAVDPSDIHHRIR